MHVAGLGGWLFLGDDGAAPPPAVNLACALVLAVDLAPLALRIHAPAALAVAVADEALVLGVEDEGLVLRPCC